MKEKLDTDSAGEITLRCALFNLTILQKEFGKDFVEEAGELLGSLKLMTTSFKNTTESQAIRKDLDQILMHLRQEHSGTEADKSAEARNI